MLCHQDGDTMLKLSLGYGAGDTVSELCQEPFAVIPRWGHCPGTLCLSPGLRTLCLGTRLVTQCLGTLRHGTGLGALCLTHAKCHRTILRHCVQVPVAVAQCWLPHWGPCPQSVPHCRVSAVAPGWGPCAGSLPPHGAVLGTCHRTRLGITLGTLSPSWTGDTVPKSLFLGGSGETVLIFQLCHTEQMVLVVMTMTGWQWQCPSFLGRMVTVPVVGAVTMLGWRWQRPCPPGVLYDVGGAGGVTMTGWRWQCPHRW